jgi:hypothetical protein
MNLSPMVAFIIANLCCLVGIPLWYYSPLHRHFSLFWAVLIGGSWILVLWAIASKLLEK